MDVSEIEQRLVEIIKRFAGKIPPEQLEGMTVLAQHSEMVIALENLCTQIFELDLQVSAIEFREIVHLGTALGVDPEYWTDLSRGA